MPHMRQKRKQTLESGQYRLKIHFKKPVVAILPSVCSLLLSMIDITGKYLNFSSKNTVKDSCASAISCKSSSNENVSFTAFMT